MVGNKAADDLFIYHEIGIHNHAAEIISKVHEHLADVQADILDQLRDDLEWSAKRPERMRDLRRSVAEMQHETHKALRKDLTNDLVDLADYEADWATDFYGKVADVTIALRKPSAGMLRSFVTSKPFQGEVLSSWARKMERAQLERINRQIVIGLTEGEDIGEIVDRLRGKKALKYRDGQFAKDARGAESLVRTAVNHVSNQAHKQFGIDNRKEFPRYRWSSVTDHRTTPVCRERAGRIYVTDEGPVPPAHWACRSRIVFISRYDDEEKEERTYANWLREQPKDIVEDSLGKKRAQLYLKGKLDVDRFTTKSGVQWKLSELKKREKAAWTKVFGE